MPDDRRPWDAIVVGSGLGGLAAGAAFARKGKRVLVLERLSNFGGAATIYRHGSLTMEASLHETDGDTIFGPTSAFAHLGLQGALDPVAIDVFYEVRSSIFDGPVRIPHGLAAAEAELGKCFPEARAGLGRYFAMLKRLRLSMLELSGSNGPRTFARLLGSGRLFELIRLRRRTLAEQLEICFPTHEPAKLALGAPLVYFDSDPAKLSFILFGAVTARYIESGSYYFRGGSRALTMALIRLIKDGGGEALHSRTVERVLLDKQGHAAGVRHRGAQGEVRDDVAAVVFGNAAPSMLAEMLPDAQRVTFERAFARFEPSNSLFTVSLGLSRPAADFGVGAYSTFVYPDTITRLDQAPAAAAVLAGEPLSALPPYVIADYGRLDTGLRRDDRDPYLVTLSGVDQLSNWNGLDADAYDARRARWMDALIGDLDRRFPGIAAVVTQHEMATARTLRHYLGTPQGEVYGFRPTPERMFARPPTPRTSVPGLWIASAYTVSGGYAGAIQGGLMAARAASR